MKMKIENSGFTIPAGVHDATIRKIKEVTTQYGEALKFFFAVTDVFDENGEAPVINGLCSANKLTPSTKLYRWVSAMTDTVGPLKKDVEINFADYEGKSVKILVVNAEKNGQEYSNVTEIIGIADIPF